MPKLIITEGPDAGREFAVEQAVILGRLETNDVPIRDKRASREHAKIYRQGDRYAIVDLNSSNGTFVNDEKVTKRLLRPGDEIRIGIVRLRFEDPEAEQAETAAPGRKRLDEAFAGARPGPRSAAAPADPAGGRMELRNYQPLQFRRVKRGRPILGFDLDQISDEARLILYLVLVAVFGAVIYIGYLIAAGG